MPTRMETGLKTLVLALYDEAALTAAAKGLTGTMAELAALRETASLAAAAARRPVTEEEVLGAVLATRRVRGAVFATRPDVPAVRPRRGRLAVWAMRSLARRPSVALV